MEHQSSPRPVSPHIPCIAVIGGGQLARMMAEEASVLGLHMRALVEAADGSTGQVLPDCPVGSADDGPAVRSLASGAAALTFEHEHQDDALLRELQNEGVSVQPAPDALLLARDKLAMRRAMAQAELPQPAWAQTSGSAESIRQDIEDFGREHGWPLVLKTPRGGYDGHGVLLVSSPQDLRQGEAAVWIARAATRDNNHATVQHGVEASTFTGSLGGEAVTSLLIEQAVPFTRELAVLLARTPSGQIATWPVVESRQHDGICAEVISPAPGLEAEAVEWAQRIGRDIASRFDVTGVLAVELFAVESPGRPTALYINELAMRPHNSGHWTQDGAVTSQFAQHLRAVADLPLGSTEPTVRATVMVNYLGGPHQPGPQAYEKALSIDPQAHIHLYGKEWRKGRKLGHVNLTLPGDPSLPPTGEEVEALLRRARCVAQALRDEDLDAQ